MGSHDTALDNWWTSTFTPEERRVIIDRFRPLGGSSDFLTEDRIQRAPGGPVSFLTQLSGWFRTPAEKHLASRMLEKAEQLAEEGAGRNVLDYHFLLMEKIKANYKDRDTRTGALDAAIDACYSQIAISRQTVKRFRREYGDFLPSHTGFKQLAIIREKQSAFDEAIALCTRAKGEGWMGDWDKRIARCEKKREKQAK